ncbi:hypothetical protein QBC38DRAFT_179378 [Podospora fimiseda]|uniref:Uncharacterized protein n=1 Tax=Podospora fimiseda TaxID=252190 RepID=A0AAN7H5M8_9PEZI|nr:hypothetical protein QBC38DRAFT_179378 [Podospora fimiseda]
MLWMNTTTTTTHGVCVCDHTHYTRLSFLFFCVCLGCRFSCLPWNNAHIVCFCSMTPKLRVMGLTVDEAHCGRFFGSHTQQTRTKDPETRLCKATNNRNNKSRTKQDGRTRTNVFDTQAGKGFFLSRKPYRQGSCGRKRGLSPKVTHIIINHHYHNQLYTYHLTPFIYLFVCGFRGVQVRPTIAPRTAYPFLCKRLTPPTTTT